MAKPRKPLTGAGKRVWRRLRIEPYNPNARDADNDGIVQEGTAWERPAGTRVLRGSLEVSRGETASSATRGEYRIVDEDGNEVDYTRSYEGQAEEATGVLDQPSGGTSPLADAGTGTLQERGLPSVRDLVQAYRAEEAKDDEDEEPDLPEYGIESVAPDGQLYPLDRLGTRFTGDESRSVGEPIDVSEERDWIDLRDDNDLQDLPAVLIDVLEGVSTRLDAVVRDQFSTGDPNKISRATRAQTKLRNFLESLDGDIPTTRDAMSMIDMLNNLIYAADNNLDIRPTRDEDENLWRLTREAESLIAKDFGAGGLIFQDAPGEIEVILAQPAEVTVAPLSLEGEAESVSDVFETIKEKRDRATAALGAFFLQKYGDGEAPWMNEELPFLFETAYADALDGDTEALNTIMRGVYEHDEIVTPTGWRFRTQLDSVRASVIGGRIEVRGKIFAYDEEAQEWKQVGTFERDFNNVGEPGAYVSNVLMTVGNKFPTPGSTDFYDRVAGQGFGSLFNGHAFTWLKGMGVQKVTVSAAWQGHHVWPRAGFRRDQRGSERSADLARRMIRDYRAGADTPIKDDQMADRLQALIDIAENMEYVPDAPQNLEYMTALEDGTPEQRRRINDAFGNSDWFPGGELDFVNIPDDPRDALPKDRDGDPTAEAAEGENYDIDEETLETLAAIDAMVEQRRKRAHATVGAFLREKYGDDEAPWEDRQWIEDLLDLVVAYEDFDPSEDEDGPEVERQLDEILGPIFNHDEIVTPSGWTFRTEISGFLIEEKSEGRVVTVDGRIWATSPDGRNSQVGQFGRGLVFDADDNSATPIAVINDILKLDDEFALDWVEPSAGFDSFADEAKGQGFAGLFNGHTTTWLKAAGFERATLSTAWDGPYVWPRAGFRAPPSTSIYVASKMEEQVELYRRGARSIIANDEQAKVVTALIMKSRAFGHEMDAPQNLEYMIALGLGVTDPGRNEEIRNFFTDRQMFPNGILSFDTFPDDPRTLALERDPVPGERAKLPVGFTEDAIADRTDLVEPTPPRRPFEPPSAPFDGAAVELLAEADGDWDRFMELLDERGYVVIDYETTGLDVDNDPVQVGLVKVQNGQIVARKNIFMNPGSPLGEWSAQNLRDADGNPITPEWLESQRSADDVHREVIDFIDDKIIMAHNVRFDREVLERTLVKHGIEWEVPGHIDTLSLLRQAIPTDPDGVNGPPRHTLVMLTEFFDVQLGDAAHTADADSEATHNVFRAARDRISASEALPDLFDSEAQQERARAAREQFIERRKQYQADLEQYQRDLAEYQRAVVRGEEPEPGSNILVEPDAMDTSPETSRPLSETRPFTPGDEVDDGFMFSPLAGYVNDDASSAPRFARDSTIEAQMDLLQEYTDEALDELGDDWQEVEVLDDYGRLRSVSRGDPLEGTDADYDDSDYQQKVPARIKQRMTRLLARRLADSGAFDGDPFIERDGRQRIFINERTGRVHAGRDRSDDYDIEISPDDPNYTIYRLEAAVERAVSSWAIGAWDSDSAGLQSVAAQRFDITDNVVRSSGSRVLRDGASEAIFDAMYQETQRFFEASDIRSVPVHRGMTLHDDAMGNWWHDTPADSPDFTPNAAVMRAVADAVLEDLQEVSGNFDQIRESVLESRWLEEPGSAAELLSRLEELRDTGAFWQRETVNTGIPWMDDIIGSAVNRAIGTEEFRDVGEVSVELSPLNSFSYDRGMAREFAAETGRGEGPQVSMVLSTRSPVERVFATPGTGPGSSNESEVIMIGGRTTVSAEYVANDRFIAEVVLDKIIRDLREFLDDEI